MKKILTWITAIISGLCTLVTILCVAFYWYANYKHDDKVKSLTHDLAIAVVKDVVAK